MDIKQFNYSDPRRLPPPPPVAAAAPSPGPVSGRIDIRRSLRVHALAATLVTLLTFGLGLAIVIRHRPFYAATAVVYVSPTFPATLNGDKEQDFPEYESYILEQTRTVTRYDILADALHQMRPELQRRLQHPGESEESAISRLQKRLDVTRAGLTYQMDISMESTIPDDLAEIVNTITDSYLKKMKNEEFYGRDERLASLKQARDQVQKDLNAALAEQNQISQTLGVAVVGGGTNGDQLDSQEAQWRSDLTEAREHRIEAEAQLDALQNGASAASSPALNAAADELIAQDPGLMALKQSISQKRALLLGELAGMTPNNPLRKATEAELKSTEDGLQRLQNDQRTRAAGQLQQKLRADVRRTQMIEAKLQGNLAASTAQAKTAAPKFQRADQLKAQIADLQAQYTALDNRARTLELESNSPGSVHMFSPARQPLEPLPSTIRKLGILLLPFSLMMGLGAVIAIDLLDPRIFSPIDVEHALGFSPIGSIFDESEVTMQAYDECSLRLAAGIDQAARNAGVRTVVLTGVHSGAGTSTIVEELGSTLAKLGRKTLTIDASGVAPPVAYLTMGYNRPAPKPDSGSSAQAEDANRSRLQTAVVAQPISSHLAPLHSFMDQAFQDLTKEYDLVLIDATPLLISAETEYLARFADVTVLVSESGKTRKVGLKRAAHLLERLNVRGIAVVINKISLLHASRATKQDLADFEAHVNRMNLRWRPSSRPSPIAGVDGVEGYPGAEPSAESYATAEQPAAKENATYV
jgi:polysaccharide biosynthesis transport protein